MKSLTSSRDKKFDHALFERILRRAVELESERGENHFSEKDVVAAAQELGINEDITRDAAREVLGRVSCNVPRPPSTRVLLEVSDEALKMIAPPVPIGAGQLATMVLALPWLAVTALWTWDIAKSLGFMPCLFSIPFWSMGLRMLLGTLRDVVEWNELRLHNDGGELLRRWGPLERATALAPVKLRCRFRERRSLGAGLTKHSESAHLELEQGSLHVSVLRHHPEPDLAWLHAEITTWLANMPKPS